MAYSITSPLQPNLASNFHHEFNQKKANSKQPKKHAVQWKDGIVQSHVDETFQAQSQSIGLQHAMDILGELLLDASISPYSSSGERALNGTFDTRLFPFSIRDGTIVMLFLSC